MILHIDIDRYMIKGVEMLISPTNSKGSMLKQGEQNS